MPNNNQSHGKKQTKIKNEKNAGNQKNNTNVNIKKLNILYTNINGLLGKV
jgi:hypothetical protein